MAPCPLPPWLIAVLSPVLALVAAAYAAVGLGGGTGYLALLSLVGAPQACLPSTALILNVVVTGASLARFGLAGRLRWALFLPFLIPAVPAAFIGGLVVAPRGAFMGALALGLVVAAVATLLTARHADAAPRVPGRGLLWLVGTLAGALIGFASGFVGIGGGVFLGPTVLFLRWAGPKEVAPMNSALILILSLVGLLGHGLRGAISVHLVAPFAVAVLVGGLAGAHLAESRLSPRLLQRVFGVIILAAGLKAGWDAVAPLLRA
jgi:uncharacterized membrane protein YfcA